MIFRMTRLAVLALALAQGGCTMFMCSGDGPLKRSELGDWAGLAPRPAPDAKALEALVPELQKIESNTFAGRYSMWGDSGLFDLNCGMVFDIPFTPAPGMVVKGRLNPWLRFWPGGQHGDWVYFDRIHKHNRQFYASEDEWDALIVWHERSDAYDVATRERLASHRTDEFIGLGLGWTRVRDVVPVTRYGEAGLHALASPSVAPDQVLYQVRDGNIVLLGIFGWGRVNRWRYVQVLWIPIPVAKVVP